MRLQPTIQGARDGIGGGLLMAAGLFLLYKILENN